MHVADRVGCSWGHRRNQMGWFRVQLSEAVGYREDEK